MGMGGLPQTSQVLLKKKSIPMLALQLSCMISPEIGHAWPQAAPRGGPKADHLVRERLLRVLVATITVVAIHRSSSSSRQQQAGGLWGVGA